MVTLAGCLLLAVALFAQPQAQKRSEEQRKKVFERIQSEKIAFLTNALDLNPEEAQKFWPVYNEAERSRRVAFKKVMQAYDAMEEAVKSGLPAKEVEKRIEAYVDAQEDARDIDGKYVEKYLRILPAEKVARLLVAEEKFRRNPINRLHERGGAGGPNGGPRAGKRPDDRPQ